METSTDGGLRAGAHTNREQAWIEAAGLMAVVFLSLLVYIISPVTTSTDSAWTFHVAASMLRQGNVDLDEYRSLIDLQNDYRMREVQGHIYSYYPVATPLLVTPAVWIVNKLYPLIYPTDFYTYLQSHAPNERTARLEKLLAAVIGAAAAALMYLIARRELSIARSVLLAGIFAFGTSMWSTATRALWQHGPSALLLALALLLLLRAKQNPGRGFWIGVILAFAYLVRPTNSLAVAFIGLYFLVNEKRTLWIYAAGVVTVMVPYLLGNWLTYQNIFPPYSYQLFERLATPAVFAEGLAGTLISPGRGLFVFTPVFLFALCGIYRRLQGAALLKSLDFYLAAILLTHWIIISMFEDWAGAWSIGARYFVDVIPLFIYFLIPLLRDEILHAPGWRYAFASTVLIGILIQLHCSTSIYPFTWNGKPVPLVEAPARKWDWGDLQFLRGYCPNNPRDGRAPACWFEPHG